MQAAWWPQPWTSLLPSLERAGGCGGQLLARAESALGSCAAAVAGVLIAPAAQQCCGVGLLLPGRSGLGFLWLEDP